MEVNKGFQRTVAGIVPDDWEVKTTAEICLKIQDGTHFSPTIRGGDYLYVTSKNIGFGFLDVSTAESIDVLQHKSIYRRCDVRKGDLLLTKDGANTGNAAINNLDEEISLLSSVAFLHFDPKQQVAGYYLQQVLSAAGQNRIKGLMAGNAITRLTLDKIRKLYFAVPPFTEQRTISSALNDMDALLAALDALIAKKRLIKQGAMQELLTGKKRLPGFSGEWEVRQLSELFDFSGGFSASRDQLSSTGYCYLHYGDIHGATKAYIDVQAEYQDIPKLNISLKRISPASLLEDGDVVFVDASEDDEGASRHVVIINKGKIPYISGLHTIVAKSKTEDLDHTYRRYCFQTRHIKQQFYYYAVGTKVTGISKKNIARLFLKLPPTRTEQAAIAEILSDMDAEIAALEQRREKTRLLKQGMMQELLTGRIRLV
jgi:type I restriction enzyme S subunit